MPITSRVTWRIARPTPLPPSPCLSKHPLDLTVGAADSGVATRLDSPPDAWMETDDLDLLDDGKNHAACPRCYPMPPGAFDAFHAICGRRAISRHTMRPRAGIENACRDCMADLSCAACGWPF